MHKCRTRALAALLLTLGAAAAIVIGGASAAQADDIEWGMNSTSYGGYLDWEGADK